MFHTKQKRIVDKITNEISLLTAASIVGDMHFPSARHTLRTKQMPFSTLGHFPFFDYSSVAGVVNDATSEMFNEARRARAILAESNLCFSVLMVLCFCVELVLQGVHGLSFWVAQAIVATITIYVTASRADPGRVLKYNATLRFVCNCAPFVVVVGTWMLSQISQFSVTTDAGIILFGEIVITIASMFAAYKIVQRGAIDKITSKRKDYIVRLCSQHEQKRPIRAMCDREHVEAAWGRGLAEGNPVVYAHDLESPFVGFGSIQEQFTLAVQRKRKSKSESESEETGEERARQHEGNCPTNPVAAIDELLRQMMVSSVAPLGLPVLSGDIIVVEAHALDTSSPLLDDDGEPFLYEAEIPQEKIASGIEQGYARRYRAAQSIFVSDLTCVTLCARVVPAGTGANCDIWICVLGPPILSWSEVQQRIALLDKGPSYIEKILNRQRIDLIVTNESETSRRFRSALTYAAKMLMTEAEYIKQGNCQPLQQESIRKDKMHLIRQLATEIQEISSRWVGRHMPTRRWREEWSRRNPSGHFVSTDLMVSTRLQLSSFFRELLEKMDEFGFDVSAYRDESGRILINSDKIEQLVLGEKVQIGTMIKQSSVEAGAEHSKRGKQHGATGMAQSS